MSPRSGGTWGFLGMMMIPRPCPAASPPARHPPTPRTLPPSARRFPGSGQTSPVSRPPDPPHPATAPAGCALRHPSLSGIPASARTNAWPRPIDRAATSRAASPGPVPSKTARRPPGWATIRSRRQIFPASPQHRKPLTFPKAHVGGRFEILRPRIQPGGIPGDHVFI